MRSMLVLAVLALAACASYPEPKVAEVETAAAVRGAQEVGAERDPNAALYLTYANDQIAHAKRLIADGDNERAELVLLRARADAELSLSLARLRTEQTDAQQAKALVDEMKEKLGK
jgi:hypothetical protein